jgi:hypothetical protein
MPKSGFPSSQMPSTSRRMKATMTRKLIEAGYGETEAAALIAMGIDA